jgi:hypothetical protein
MHSIWNGIYANWEEVPRKGDGFSGKTWLESNLARMRRAKRESEQASPSPAAYNRNLLPVVAAMVLAQLGELVLIDFGGGMGANYYEVKGSLPPGSRMHYHVIELSEVCAAGREFFAGTNDIVFHDQGLPNLDNIGLVHMGSSIQYVEDWRGLLAEVVKRAPRYVLFSDLLAGDVPTYARAQTYYDSTIPCWFFNRREFIQEMNELGYEAVFMSRFIGTFLGVEQEVPQENFPDSHKLHYACHILFWSRP